MCFECDMIGADVRGGGRFDGNVGGKFFSSFTVHMNAIRAVYKTQRPHYTFITAPRHDHSCKLESLTSCTAGAAACQGAHESRIVSSTPTTGSSRDGSC